MEKLELLSERIKYLRENDLKLTRKELADKLEIEDITEEKIGWYEDKRILACPDARFFYALEEKFGVNYIWLLTGIKQ